MNAGAQTALRRILKRDLAAVTARHVAGNRQAETDSSGRRIAGGIEPDECAERAIPICYRYPGSVVINQDIDSVSGHDRSQPDVAAVAACIIDQVTYATTQGVGSHQHHEFGW